MDSSNGNRNTAWFAGLNALGGLDRDQSRTADTVIDLAPRCFQPSRTTKKCRFIQVANCPNFSGWNGYDAAVCEARKPCFRAYNNYTQIEFDPVKARLDQGKHSVSLAMAEAFEIDVALAWRDEWFDYSEKRFTALGPIGERIYSLSFTMRGETLRAISLRKADRREVLK